MDRCTKFTLTSDHIKLIENFNIRWDDSMYYGAPSVDPKMPYGDSMLNESICKILGWGEPDDEGDLPDRLTDKALKIHREMETALRIVLQHKSFESGEFELVGQFNYFDWTRVSK